jgi:Ku70/Ku80 beta-barrel domain
MSEPWSGRWSLIHPPPSFSEYHVHGPSCQLERLPAFVARHLSGRAVPGHLREREDLVQSAESKDRPPHQVPEGGRADTGEEVPNEHIVKGYALDKDTFIEVSKEELENVALESTRTIEIDEFVDRSKIDTRYLIRPYCLGPDGKVGHDAFSVIRETIREMDKVAIGRVVLTNREHIFALEPLASRYAPALPVRNAVGAGVFRGNPGRQSYQRHARSRQAHR